ncbi:hypothetical protein DPX39_110027700 [Trypanosoma brucei equiperdum]|uniref:Uncharacterized protein n=1 Tax=Trypanosoma brucei equiperdum TaxID=630700 RepID=A0A3L6KVF5_9TRYP|nr:hypothetical protein DPX39_110027700 [Trypanosoma brucei equiperdum]
MQDLNWALAEKGTKVVEVSHEAAHVASSATNLLVDREELLWITGDAPQHVTLRLANSHPPLNYVGWHVWHDYVTNPKTVEVATGESPDEMVAQIVCQAVAGAGTQIWKLPSPIPANHLYVRMKIVETFGPGPTYLNNLVLFADDPGSRFRILRGEERDKSMADPRNLSSGKMSVLLQELGQDIRSLHPIKTVASKKNMLLYVPKEPDAVIRPQGEEDVTFQSSSQHANNITPRCGTDSARQCHLDSGSGFQASSDFPGGFNERLCALEQAVASLTQTMNHQREDLTMIKRLLLQQATDRRREIERQGNGPGIALPQHGTHPVSHHQVCVDFPERALRTFVEEVVRPKLQKHSRRTETQTIAKLDEFLKDIIGEMTQVVDERVRFHIQRASCNSSVSTGFHASCSGGSLQPCSPHLSVSGVNASRPSVIADSSIPQTNGFPPGSFSSSVHGYSAAVRHNSPATSCHDPISVPSTAVRDVSFEVDMTSTRNTTPRPQ